MGNGVFTVSKSRTTSESSTTESEAVVSICTIHVLPAKSSACAFEDVEEDVSTTLGEEHHEAANSISSLPGNDDSASCASVQSESVCGDAVDDDKDVSLLAMPKCEHSPRSRPSSAINRWRIFVEEQVMCDKREQMILWEAKEALESISKPSQQAFKKTIVDLQRQLFQAFKENDQMLVATLFENLKTVVVPESERLEGLVASCMEKYKIGKARWKFLESIHSYDDELPQRILSELGDMPNGDKLAVLLAEAEWRRPHFQEMVLALARNINRASNITEICNKYGLDQKELYLPLESGNPYDFGGTASPGTLVKVHFGPPKSSDRAEAKGVEWLLDLNRATLEFEDPYVLAVAYRMLSAQHAKTITVVQNKFLQDRFTQPPNLHLIIDLNGWKVELQLILSDFLKIKYEQHKLYEIIRANEPRSVLKPIYEIPLPNK